MSWTEEQEEIMIHAAKNGLSVEETSASLIEAGYKDRTVRSIKAKWRYMYKTPFGEFNDYEEVVEELSEELDERIEELSERIEKQEEKKRKSFKTRTLLFVLVGIGIAAYGWETGIWTI
jgi:hypothetical protein|tara:strand:+ start:1797 stop:2153 length:357 start_codon:yes stop_codon:yes gene_type:complete